MTDKTIAPETADAFSQSEKVDAQADATGDGLFVVALREQIADWSADCLSLIDRLRELKQNWDSYGANPVDLNSIAVAKELVRSFDRITGIDCPRVAASPAGHVALSWEWQEHSRELDLEILPDGALRYSYLDEPQPNRDCEGETNNPSLIVQLLTQW